MNKTMIFTVTDTDSKAKPTVWAQMASDKAVSVHNNAISLIAGWFLDNDISVGADEIEDLAYSMRKDGYAWHGERFCFELTDVCG